LREHRSAADIHGESGLDGPVLEPGRLPLDPRPAAELIVDLVTAAGPGELTLVATAPLTNLALARRREPGIAGRVRGVAIMGGAIGAGNVTPGWPPGSTRSGSGTWRRTRSAACPDRCADLWR
jgi:purine nucleosidase